MIMSKATLLAIAAASACLLSAEAFAPAQSRSVVRQSAPLPFASLDNDVESEEAPEEFIVNEVDLEAEAVEEDDGTPPSWYVHEQTLKELREQYRRSETDTGSPEFQVAGMTERISYLTKHLKEHPRDFSTRRGLVALVNKRRRLLNFLFREDQGRYVEVVKGLGIRHKPPSPVQSREDQYGRFPRQKAVKKHLVTDKK